MQCQIWTGVGAGRDCILCRDEKEGRKWSMLSSKSDGSQKARSWIVRVSSSSILNVEVDPKISNQIFCMSWAICSSLMSTPG
jgi:hypothetical protein